MTDTDKILLRIEKLLARLVEQVNPYPVKEPVKGEGEVTAVSREHGHVRVTGDAGDVPSVLTADQKDAMAGRGRRTARTETRPVEGRSGWVR